MKTHYIALAVAALAIAACAETVEQPEPEGIQITIHAYQEGAVDTKTTVQDGGTQVYWEPNDEIKVFFKGNGSRFISQNTEFAAVADFTGSLTIAVGANEGASSSNLTWGLYPYRADATSDGSSVTTTLPASQTGRAGSFAKNTHICLAASGGYDLAFYNVTGGIRFSLTQEGIKSVTFQGNNGENLAGKIKMVFEGGIPAIQEVSEGETVLTLTAPGGGTFQTGKWYYIEALPGTLSKGFKMVFSKGSESAKLSTSSSVTISRGKYGSLADADEGLIFKPDGGGDDPDPSSVIQFADPIAKYACVEKFDTNGDGEVSYEEAAAATSLYGLFKDWNTVTHFDEIKYFTGVTTTDGVFTGLAKLESITIPNFITALGTFQNCSSLMSVVLPSGLNSLPSSCFRGCSALTDVAIPSAITSIPPYCFDGCSALAGIDLPAGVKTIGNNAFSGCFSISSIDFPSTLSSIGSSAFADCTSLTAVVLPSDMTAIPKGLFSNCTALKTITWPSALQSVGDSAFYGCVISKDDSDASMIELPATVKTIGSQAFQGVRHLIMPSTSAISIASDSFSSGFTRLYVPAGMVEMYKVRTNWSVYERQLFSINDYPSNNISPIANMIDLGLSVNWASWNVGASRPEEYGDHFAWGETETQWSNNYNWSTYKWNSEHGLIKYNNDVSAGVVDNKNVLDLEDDSAYVQWGGNWRIPTDAEWTELIDNCTWDWTTSDGVNGYRITSNLPGYTSNYIFLPASGFISNNFFFQSLSQTSSIGLYSSSSIADWNNHYIWHIHFSSSGVGRSDSYLAERYSGRSIRPVCPKD